MDVRVKNDQMLLRTKMFGWFVFLSTKQMKVEEQTYLSTKQMKVEEQTYLSTKQMKVEEQTYLSTKQMKVEEQNIINFSKSNLPQIYIYIV